MFHVASRKNSTSIVAIASATSHSPRWGLFSRENAPPGKTAYAEKAWVAKGLPSSLSGINTMASNFTMSQFMLSATYYKGLGGCSDCEAQHVSYHAQQMFSEMVSRPRLKELFCGDHSDCECYKEQSMAWQSAVAHGQAIDSRLESQGFRSIYASSWANQSKRLVSEFFEAELLLEEELSDEYMIVPSAEDFDDDVF